MTTKRCQDEQSDDVDDLNHRVDGGAGGVLVGIADGVTGDREPRHPYRHDCRLRCTSWHYPKHHRPTSC